MIKITLLQAGKTHFGFVDEGFSVFESRLRHYCRFEQITITLPVKLKSADAEVIKKNEGDLMLKKLLPTDYVILLDEKGKQFSSIEFAAFIRKRSVHSAKIIFVIGGAYGFSEQMYARANDKISLSSMTFSHQVIRLIFAEQLYRAFTIVKGEPYHHE